MSDVNMYRSKADFDGITLRVDPIGRKRTEGSDNVMAMFHEEQPFTWATVKSYVAEALKESKGNVDFVDVGTGSGVFGILMTKHFGAKVVAIDKSSRAIEMARKNAKLNGVELELKHELYSAKSVPLHSAKVIGLYPPYHLYPQEIEGKIPQHARGGSDGQEEFRNQLAIAGQHVAKGGIIFYNQMCLGGPKGPAFLEYIPKIVGGNPSIVYFNVFAPIETKVFLEGVYGDKHPDYVKETSDKFPVLYYTVGIIKADGKGEISEASSSFDLKGRSWADRILLHQEIAAHEYK